MKIVSFGDSFIFGNELQNNIDGSKAWPGLIAKELNCKYETLATPGCGNDAIAQQVYSYFSTNSNKNTLVVINWTWSMRWDFYLVKPDTWINLGPTCVPDKIKNQIDHPEANRLITFYKDYISESTVWNHYKSLQAIYGVQSFLKEKNIKSIQTYMDCDLFLTNLQKPRVEHYYAVKDATWPDINNEQEFELLPDSIRQEVNKDYYNEKSVSYIKLLRELTLRYMSTFEGNTFLEWSYKNEFAVTPSPRNHPLEEAHSAAKELWKKSYASALDINL